MGMELKNNRVRLAETISWCLAQTLESAPSETAEVQHRRNMIDRAGELMRTAHRGVKKDDIGKMRRPRAY
jgi:hypothetical protein